ncbi:MAG: VWA domain-containing protein, partial [Polyangiales bacterium]
RYPLDKARYEVMLEVQNLGDKDEQIELSLYGDDVLVDLSKLQIKAGEKLPRFYPNLGGASRTLEARINAVTPDLPKKDDLQADDRAFAVLPERRRTKVLAITPGNTYLEAALLLDEYLEVTTATPGEMSVAFGKGKYDVAIYDGVTPNLRPGIPALYLDPRGNDGPVKIDPKPLAEPSFDKLERKHPILRWTVFENIGIASGTKLIPGDGDKVVGASDAGPILVAGQRNHTKFVVLGFDVRQSDLPLRIAWPVFLLNCVNWFVEEDAEYLSSFKTGDVWHVPAPLGATTTALLIDPDGKKHTVPVQEGRAVYFGTRAGFYRLQAPPGPAANNSDGSRRADVVFAANLVDPTESAIKPMDKLVVDGKEGGMVAGFKVGVRKELWIYLLVAVAIITAIEWATYHRRVTV